MWKQDDVPCWKSKGEKKRKTTQSGLYIWRSSKSASFFSSSLFSFSVRRFTWSLWRYRIALEGVKMYAAWLPWHIHSHVRVYDRDHHRRARKVTRRNEHETKKKHACSARCFVSMRKKYETERNAWLGLPSHLLTLCSAGSCSHVKRGTAGERSSCCYGILATLENGKTEGHIGHKK